MSLSIENIAAALIPKYTQLHVDATRSVNTAHLGNIWAPEYVACVLCKATYSFSGQLESQRLQQRIDKAHTLIDGKFGLAKRALGDTSFNALHEMAHARNIYVTSLESTLLQDAAALSVLGAPYSTVQELVDNEFMNLTGYTTSRKNLECQALTNLQLNLVRVAQGLDRVRSRFMVKTILKGLIPLLRRDIRKVTGSNPKLVLKSVVSDAKRMKSLTNAIMDARHSR